ncbi:MAG: oligopeptide:H+ symporter [Bacteroidota bacterium]
MRLEVGVADDPRKDGAFSIFYMGVNIGSLLSILTCGYIGEEISWHYGFGLAGIGMAVGLLVFWLVGPSAFGDKGLEPDPERVRKPMFGPLNLNQVVWAATILMVPICAYLLKMDALMTTVLLVISIGIIAYLVITGARSEERIEGTRLWVVVVLFFFHMVFWALFEQAGGSLTLFAESNVDRSLFGGEIKASQLSFLNPLFVILLAPAFSWLWIRLRKSGREPSTPMKFVLGLAQLALGFAAVVIGAKMFANDQSQVSLLFLVVMYFFHTTGELSLSPVGLSMITKLSPQRIVGFVMGAWFLSISLGNKLAGAIGQLTTGGESSDAELTPAQGLEIYSDTYLTWGVGVVGSVALVLLLLVPTLRKWMGGIH